MIEKQQFNILEKQKKININQKLYINQNKHFNISTDAKSIANNTFDSIPLTAIL